MLRPTSLTRLNPANLPRNHSPIHNRSLLTIASSLLGLAMLSACAAVSTETSDQYAAAVSWTVLYETGYKATLARRAESAGSLGSATGKLVGSVQYDPCVMSLGKVAGVRDKVKAMLD